MNIVLINHYAGSNKMGMEFRPYHFAREWVKLGHRVDIIAADFSHIRRVNPTALRDFCVETIDGIYYHWVKTISYHRNGVKRAITMLEFIGKLLLNAQKIVKHLKPDVVICSSTYPLDTYVGQLIKKLSSKRVILVHEVHDMWPLSPMEIGGMSKNHPFIVAMQAAENSFCKNADIVVSLLPAAKNYFIEHGMKSERFYHIPNGVVLEEWRSYDKIEESLARHFIKNRKEGKFNLCFFGTIQKTYNLELLISAVKNLNKPNLAVTFIGPGLDKNELIRQTHGYEHVFKFFDPIKKRSIPDLFNYIDAVFIGAKNLKIARFGICMNKLFDSMMGGKPILYMVKAPNNYIKDYNCGITVQGTEQADLQKAIERLLLLSDAEKIKMGENGRNAAIHEFNYAKSALKFLDIIKAAPITPSLLP